MDMVDAQESSRSTNLIFVVEDDLDISRLIEHNLSSAGYQVSTFLSGGAVLLSATRLQPALFLLDIMLPGLSGFDLCRQIRQHEQLSKTPVIFLTARSAEPDRIRGFEMGGDDYITKPFSPRELVARVRTVLRGQPEISPPEVIQFREIEIDISSMTIRVEGRTVLTTVREFRL